MGGNGESVPPGPITISSFGRPPRQVRPGTGGGCIESGPFTNTTVNLGPVAYEPKGPDNGLGYHPRCLTRDLNPTWSNQTKPSDIVRLINSCDDIDCFNTKIEDPTGLNTASGDPAFYLHHSAIDWVWTVWQGLDLANRTNQLSGTSTAFNGETDLNGIPQLEL